MKIFLIRLEILAIILLVLSPLIYLGFKKFSPEIALLRYDYAHPLSSYPPVSPLHTKGTEILNSEGKPVILRGVNLISTNWGNNYSTWDPQAIAVAARDWHANVIRTRIYEDAFKASYGQFFLDLEREILTPAREHGMYVVIHPWFGQNDSFPDQDGVRMWLAVAARYQNDPHIIFDLLAEPRDTTFASLRGEYLQLIPQIRAIAPHALIMVTGLDWGRDINAWLAAPLPFGNLVYRTNPYNKTGEFESYFGRIALKYPVFIGEFGTENALSMAPQDVQNLLGYADDLHLGWTAWHFTATGCPCLLSSDTQFTPSAYGEIVKGALASTVYPYPTPTFDPDPSKLYVYSHFLESGFADYSWGLAVRLGSSVTTDFHNNAGLYFNTSRRLIPSDYQTFHLTLSTPHPELFTLRFKSFDNQFSPTLNLKNGANVFPTSAINLPSLSGVLIETKGTIPDGTPLTLGPTYFQK